MTLRPRPDGRLLPSSSVMARYHPPIARTRLRIGGLGGATAGVVAFVLSGVAIEKVPSLKW
jgi:hypothetical protein